MKKATCTTLLIILLSQGAISQIINKSIEIKGKFENSSNEKIYIKSENFNDSFLTNRSGDFTYKTTKITKPIKAYISIANRFRFSSYLAPGYALTITADAANKESFYNSWHLSGMGSLTNQYWMQEYLLYRNELIQGSDKWYKIKPASFIKDALGKPNLDSFVMEIQKTVFSSTNKEPFNEFFKKASILDINFRKLYYLFAYSSWNDLSLEDTDSLIKKAIDPQLFNSLNFDDYLDNFFYRETISFFYLNHLLNKEIVNNNAILQSLLKRRLEIADSMYSGKTKNFVLKTIIQTGIGETFSVQELNMLQGFIYKINDKKIRTALLNDYANRKLIINKVSVGKEAPIFNLPDTSGQKHNLQSFKGKVVYIDLWASWCGPCIEEMPALKEIHDEYSSSGNLQIISIAINDINGKEKRNKLINQLKLNWLQLEDEEDFVSNKFKVTSIPRFILIDKEGKILSFDAPRPSEQEKLRLAIDKAVLN